MDPEIIRKWSTGGDGFLRSIINYKEFVEKINIDDPTERVMLGQCYMYGLGVEKNEAEAVRLYKLSVEQCNAYGQAFLGECYQLGTGVEKDEAEAVRLYRLSAEQSNSYGQVFLGVCYNNGIGGLATDEKEAMKLYKLSAKQSNSCGQVLLGVCYQHGKGGLPIDKTKAVKLYKLSAEQNNAVVQIWLGICYEFGTGIEKDEVEAARLYKLAVKQSIDSINDVGLKQLERLKKSRPDLFVEQKPFSEQTICSDDSCSICLEGFVGVSKAVVVLQCTHKYHFCCLTKWFASKESKQCPLCRTYVNAK
jgi:TPR repeat protein